LRRVPAAFRRALGRITLGIATSYLCGCAAFQAADLSAYAADLRTVYLHNFSNTSFQPDVHFELTEAVRQELHRRGNFTLQRERDTARLWVYGEVVVYRKEGRMFDNFRNPTRVELIVACRMRLRENPAAGGGEPFDRELSARTEFSQSEGFLESELAARDRLLRQLAGRMNAALETEFVNRFAAGTGR
jgi:Lipopolysaccharide-assembly